MPAFAGPPGTSSGSPPWFTQVPEGDTTAYRLRREAALTAKYTLIDYGITAAMWAAVVAGLGSGRRRWPAAPASRWAFAMWAAAAPLATFAATAYGAFLNASRLVFAPWERFGAVPLMGLASVASALALWSLGHLTLLAHTRLGPDVELSWVALQTCNRWLLMVCSITVVHVVAVALAGYYWMLIPGFLWLYFYASIAAVRHANGHDAF